MVPVTRAPDPSGSAGRNMPQVYLVGGGIASMAAAAFMIRDGDIPGHNITIFEELDKIGGSMDGSGSPEAGYLLRGGRMFESKYLCTFELFSSIPTLDGSQSVTAETLGWNKTMKTSSKSRLFRNGKRQTAPEFGLSEKHILTIERLAIEPESMLGSTTIAGQFDPAFFKTDFWFMWGTTFAFQPWHSAVEFKRYLVRFAHMVSGFERLEGILRTVYNQYDSMIRPLEKWLDERGVVFQLNTRVTGLGFDKQDGKIAVTGIAYERGGQAGEIAVRATDHVLVTLGSMTEASSLGGMDTAPVLNGKADGGAWTLWETIAKGQPGFGRPSVFDDHIGQSKWLSFTTTMHGPDFLRIVRDLTGNVPGEGGLITFPDSNWLASIVIPHQPHFIGQPEGVSVLWGYGLSVDRARQFREESHVRLHRARNHDGNTRSSAHRGGGIQDTRDLHLYSLHDAFHHQPVSSTNKGRPAAGYSQRFKKSGLHGAVLRTAGRCGVHRRVFDTLGADRRLRAARAQARATGGI